MESAILSDRMVYAFESNIGIKICERLDIAIHEHLAACSPCYISTSSITRKVIVPGAEYSSYLGSLERLLKWGLISSHSQKSGDKMGTLYYYCKREQAKPLLVQEYHANRRKNKKIIAAHNVEAHKQKAADNALILKSAVLEQLLIRKHTVVDLKGLGAIERLIRAAIKSLQELDIIEQTKYKSPHNNGVSKLYGVKDECRETAVQLLDQFNSEIAKIKEKQ